MNDDIRIRDLTRRLDALEARNRRLRRWLLAVAALGVSTLLLGQAGFDRTIQAEEFLLRDAGGSVRGHWVADDDGTSFNLYGVNRQVTVRLRTDVAGSVISLFDLEGKPRVGVVHSFEEGPSLALLEPGGGRRLLMRDGASGAAIELQDRSNVRRATLAVTAGGPVLALSDGNGRPRVNLDAAAAGPGLSLTDSRGKKRSILRSFAEIGPQLSMFDADGNVYWQTPRP